MDDMLNILVRPLALASGFRCFCVVLTSSSLHCVQASGKGRTGDSSPGEQDEIDIEWKGNTPQQLQTNVFLAGADEAKVRYSNHMYTSSIHPVKHF
jgi:hypothetical protein